MYNHLIGALAKETCPCLLAKIFPMQLAGESYAMSDAAPGIAGYAAHVTDSVEDVLEELLRSLP